MANKNTRKKPTVAPGGGRRGKKRSSMEDDPFFQGSRKKRVMDDDVIDSGDSEEDDDHINSKAKGGAAEAAELTEETAAETRLRVANAVVHKIKVAERKQREEEEEGSDSDTERVHSRAAQILEQEQLEQTGRARRAIASKQLSGVGGCDWAIRDFFQQWWPLKNDVTSRVTGVVVHPGVRVVKYLTSVGFLVLVHLLGWSEEVCCR